MRRHEQPGEGGSVTRRGITRRGHRREKNAPLESQQKFPAEPLNHAYRREASGTLAHFRDTFEVNDASKHPGPVEQGLSARAQALEPRK